MRVILSTDGSSHARRATRWLRDLALPPETRITVLSVATLDAPPRDAQTMADLRAAAHEQAREAARRAAKILTRRWRHVEIGIAHGDPTVEIVHTAEELRAGMIVLGARGLGRVRRFLLGSTSLAAARYAPCPVAIVRGWSRWTGRVLAAVDGSTGSRAALRFLSTTGLARDRRVSLLHVAPRTAAAGARQQAEALLRDAAARLGESRRGGERLVAQGDPAREIVKIARSRDVDLVVLGARGLRTLGRLFLGSVSETVLHQVRRPVIIVRA
jgi:nucleotide-binding universal stress UspA family protein